MRTLGTLGDARQIEFTIRRVPPLSAINMMTGKYFRYFEILICTLGRFFAAAAAAAAAVARRRDESNYFLSLSLFSRVIYHESYLPRRHL